MSGPIRCPACGAPFRGCATCSDSTLPCTYCGTPVELRPSEPEAPAVVVDNRGATIGQAECLEIDDAAVCGFAGETGDHEDSSEAEGSGESVDGGSE